MERRVDKERFLEIWSKYYDQRGRLSLSKNFKDIQDMRRILSYLHSGPCGPVNIPDYIPPSFVPVSHINPYDGFTGNRRGD